MCLASLSKPSLFLIFARLDEKKDSRPEHTIYVQPHQRTPNYAFRSIYPTLRYFTVKWDIALRKQSSLHRDEILYETCNKKTPNLASW